MADGNVSHCSTCSVTTCPFFPFFPFYFRRDQPVLLVRPIGLEPSISPSSPAISFSAAVNAAPLFMFILPDRQRVGFVGPKTLGRVIPSGVAVVTPDAADNILITSRGAIQVQRPLPDPTTLRAAREADKGIGQRGYWLDS